MTQYDVTKEHERREEELADFVSRHWKCVCKLQRKFSIYDAVARAEKSQIPRAFIEFRIVNYSYNGLPEIMIPMSKLILGKQQTEMTGVETCKYAAILESVLLLFSLRRSTRLIIIISRMVI